MFPAKMQKIVPVNSPQRHLEVYAIACIIATGLQIHRVGGQDILQRRRQQSHRLRIHIKLTGRLLSCHGEVHNYKIWRMHIYGVHRACK